MDANAHAHGLDADYLHPTDAAVLAPFDDEPSTRFAVLCPECGAGRAGGTGPLRRGVRPGAAPRRRRGVLRSIGRSQELVEPPDPPVAEHAEPAPVVAVPFDVDAVETGVPGRPDVL